jgi:hypothetical protein
MARPDQDAAGRLLERAGDRTPRGMTVLRVHTKTEPGLQAGIIAHFLWVQYSMRRLQTAALVVAISTVSGARTLCAQSLPAAYTHRLQSSTITVLDRAPQPSITDTIVTSALVRLDRTAPDSSGLVEASLAFDSLRVTSGGMVRRAPDALVRGRTTLMFRDGRPEVALLDSLRLCTERPLIGLVADLTPSLPDSLAEGVAWTDSVSVSSCRAQVPLTTTLTARYLVRASADTSVWLVDRTADILLVGRATLREQPVTLDGSGSTTSLYEIRKSSRQIRSWRNTQTVETRLSNGQQTRVFRQLTTDFVLPIAP